MISIFKGHADQKWTLLYDRFYLELQNQTKY